MTPSKPSNIISKAWLMGPMIVYELFPKSFCIVQYCWLCWNLFISFIHSKHIIKQKASITLCHKLGVTSLSSLFRWKGSFASLFFCFFYRDTQMSMWVRWANVVWRLTRSSEVQTFAYVEAKKIFFKYFDIYLNMIKIKYIEINICVLILCSGK